MRAVILGVFTGLAILCLMAPFDATVEADCEFCGTPGTGSFGALASDLDVDSNNEALRNFSDEGIFSWCREDYDPWAGAAQFVSENSSNVNSVDVTPSFTNVSDCFGDFPVTCAGKLDVGQATGTCEIYGFVYQPPLLDDTHVFTVHELP